ncbi:MAG TPA: hypothetical protein VGD08_16140 [Stellaceae bacterium]|jgi:hypothetical protein
MFALYVIAVMMCDGTNCVVRMPEPGITYPNEAQCLTALDRKGAILLNAAGTEGTVGGRTIEISCVEVEG